MTQRLDQLNLALNSIKAEIRTHNDSLAHLRWQLEELALRQVELLKEIEKEQANKIHPCVIR